MKKSKFRTILDKEFLNTEISKKFKIYGILNKKSVIKTLTENLSA